MKINKWFALSLGITAAVSATNASALVVNTSSDGSLLANTILGSGISISNITYTGAAGASGTFSDGMASGIGISSGIILTTGSAADAVGPNTSDGTTTDNAMAGDTDLNGLIPGYQTYDATVLEFDFTSTGGDVYFNYVFASEEYNEFVGSIFNDVFGFYLDGTNIAIFPGTTTPVAINTVNCGIDGVTASGPNCASYNNNDPTNSTTPYNIEYDGFTDMLTASFLGLTTGPHHIKLAIADAGDYVLDSAVFIQAGSFSDNPTGVPEPGTIALMGAGLLGIALRRKKQTKH